MTKDYYELTLTIETIHPYAKAGVISPTKEEFNTIIVPYYEVLKEQPAPIDGWCADNVKYVNSHACVVTWKFDTQAKAINLYNLLNSNNAAIVAMQNYRDSKRPDVNRTWKLAHVIEE